MRRKALSLIPLLIFTLLIYLPLGGWKLFSSEVATPSQEPRVYGDSAAVPGFQWVEIINEGGVRTNITLRKYEDCLLRYRGEVSEVLNHESFWSWVTGERLMEYSPPPAHVSNGVLCPEGTVFYLAPENMPQWQAAFEERFAFEDTLKAEINGIRDSTPQGRTQLWDEFFTWVEVLNPEGIANFGYEVTFLDTCGLEEGGEIRAVGNTSQGLLYEYRPDPTRGYIGMGIPCPARTLFLMDGPKTRYF